MNLSELGSTPKKRPLNATTICQSHNEAFNFAETESFSRISHYFVDIRNGAMI